MSLLITSLVFNDLQQRLRADRNSNSFLLFPLGTSDAVKPKRFYRWIIYASNTVINSNTQTHLYSLSLEERKAEHRLLANGKLVVIMLKTIIKFNILF